MRWLWLLIFLPLSGFTQPGYSIFLMEGVITNQSVHPYPYIYKPSSASEINIQVNIKPFLSAGINAGKGVLPINGAAIKRNHDRNSTSGYESEDLQGKYTSMFTLGAGCMLKLNSERKIRVEIPLKVGVCDVIHTGFSYYSELWPWGVGPLGLEEQPISAKRFYKSAGVLLRMPVLKWLDFVLSGSCTHFTLKVKQQNFDNYGKAYESPKDFLILNAAAGVGIRLGPQSKKAVKP